ncbi:MAG: recombination mediator RecR [Acidobacteriota bacterium]|nr:recombination mediator RecR [Acidobacteriota bacterium]MDQ5872256.1 recombination mediator RecR [Acidobacteriota bacterium]
MRLKGFDRLVSELQRLPGIGAKSAARLAYYLLRAPIEEAGRLSQAISESRAAVRRCSICNTLTETDPCEICSDPERDASILCVVEEPGNVAAIEKTREFRGRYHVLWGALSPLRGIGPTEIDVEGLVRRVTPEVTEVVLATNPNVEGEATALYIAKRLKPGAVRVTRIAFGLPVGGDIEYADEVTMARSLENRREL